MTDAIEEQYDERGGLLSASAGERVYYCPGSLNAALEAKRSGAAPAPEALAAEGDEIHEALEEETIENLPDETAEIVKNLGMIGMQALGDWQVERAVVDSPTIKRETRMWIRNDAYEPIASAKLDLGAVSGTEGFVLDYKSGYKPVTDAPSNIQLRLQALALWHEYDKSINHIRAVAAQYRLSGRVMHADYNKEQLEESERELHLMLWRAKQANAPRVPGEWCSYCPANASCRQAAAYSMLPIPIVARRLGMENNAVKPDSVLDAIPRLSPQELLFIYEKGPLITKIMRNVRMRLYQLPDEVLKELGFWKKPNSDVREVVAVDKAYDALADTLSQQEFVSCCDLKIRDLEDLYARKAKERHGTLKAAKVQFTKLLKEAGAIRMKKRMHSLKLQSEKGLADAKTE